MRIPKRSQFIHKLSNDLSTSLWSTRIGGTGNENISPSAFLVSVCDQIYFSGWGGSTNSAGAGSLKQHDRSARLTRMPSADHRWQ